MFWVLKFNNVICNHCFEYWLLTSHAVLNCLIEFLIFPYWFILNAWMIMINLMIIGIPILHASWSLTEMTALVDLHKPNYFLPVLKFNYLHRNWTVTFMFHFPICRYFLDSGFGYDSLFHNKGDCFGYVYQKVKDVILCVRCLRSLILTFIFGNIAWYRYVSRISHQ